MQCFFFTNDFCLVSKVFTRKVEKKDRWPELLTVLSMLVYAKNNTDFFSSLFCDLDCTLSMRIKLEEFP